MKRARLDFFAETQHTEQAVFSCCGDLLVCYFSRNLREEPAPHHPTLLRNNARDITLYASPATNRCRTSVCVCTYLCIEQVVPSHKYCRQKQAGWRIRSKYCRREKHEPREAVKAAAKSLCLHVVSYHKMLVMSGKLLRYTYLTDNLGPICPKTLVWHGRSPVVHTPELFVSCACANHCLCPSFAIPPRMPLSQAMDERRCTHCLLMSETNGVLSLSHEQEQTVSTPPAAHIIAQREQPPESSKKPRNHRP